MSHSQPQRAATPNPMAEMTFAEEAGEWGNPGDTMRATRNMKGEVVLSVSTAEGSAIFFLTPDDAAALAGFCAPL